MLRVCISQHRPYSAKNVVANIDVDRKFSGQILNSCNSKPLCKPIVFHVDTGTDVTVIPKSYTLFFLCETAKT